MMNETRMAAHEDQGGKALLDVRMVTLQMKLVVEGHALTLALPEAEWRKLVRDFAHMPADERQRVGASICNATAQDPFPLDGQPLDPKGQQKCDAFVSDCILLAALAETVGKRVLADTAVEGYQLVYGNLVKPRLN
ncbi:MAG: hypothetical protein GC129_04605 [Proteobacteria bacterium]|nr:hypothetical protein [Pseudomonadota bacterium]